MKINNEAITEEGMNNMNFELTNDKKSIKNAKPILKWAGGKTQMLDVLHKNAPKTFNKYIEPFFGGGAYFFSLKPETAVIADLNEELVNLYKTVAENVHGIIDLLKRYPNEKEFFLALRAKETKEMTNVERAARTIYLNRTCFNGLYRVNRKGQFNVPFGKYTNPRICDEDNLLEVSNMLKDVTIIHGDYKAVLKEFAEPGDFIFLDPPYLPISQYSDFKRYTKEQFYEEDHIQLADEVKRLHELGCHVLLTNSNHPLVHELYEEFEISIHQTRRNINKNASKRTGEDVLVKVLPKKNITIVPDRVVLSDQVKLYPSTRYMGSKKDLIGNIWGVASHFDFESVTDLFAGSGIVSYMFKAQGKQVLTNDYMKFSSLFGKALIENNSIRLSDSDILKLISPADHNNHFVSETFKGIYFNDEDNTFIDMVRNNVPKLRNKTKEALALSALVRACMKRRPRGIFTFVGLDKYNDGRKDLQMKLSDHFLEAVSIFNNAVFDNDKANKSRHGDALSFNKKSDIVYIDPPYYSPHSDNEYVRRYHFVEGLARDWKGVEIQEHTKTKKFKNYPTPFSSRKGAHDAFDLLFAKHKDSVLIVSYSSNSLPTKDEMLALLAKHKTNVDVISVDHRYSFGNQNHKISDNNNKVQEYLFVGY